MALYGLNGGSKGQTFMPDYLASLLIFGVVIGVFFASYQGILSNQAEFQAEKQIRRQAVYTSAFLVTTPGYPENWEEGSVDVQIPGFAEAENVLDEQKLEEFRSLSYERQTTLVQAQNFFLQLRNSSGTVEIDGSGYKVGVNYTDSADTVVPIERSVLVNTSKGMIDARLRYVAWR